ncbi:Uncharacterised protein [Chlamydia trachomatis]|nr:Uncharacterised protein [Chlamydia trachomatis]
MDKEDKFRFISKHSEIKEPISLDKVPERVVKGLYKEFEQQTELYDKLNVAYAIAEFYK